jgi:branched-chain amino acid transport system substrate-binding protein
MRNKTMKFFRHVLNIFIGLAIVWVGFGCNAAPETVKIGLIVPTSGEHADSTGLPAVNAAQMAVDEVNEAGGLLVGDARYQIELIVADNEGVPETAVSAAHHLINQEGVVAIIGPMFSSNAIPVGKVAEAAQIPMISPTSTNLETTLDKEFVFRASFVDDFQGQAMARFAYETLGIQKTAVLYDVASSYNQGLAATYEAAFKALGGEVVVAETYTTDRNDDFVEQLTAIQAHSPGALFLPNYTDDVLIQGQQARDLGIDAVILGGDSWEASRLAPHAIFENSFFSGHYCRDKSISIVRDFSDRFEALYGREPNGLMALTYDSMHLLFAAMQNQNNVTPEAIQAGLYQNTYEGITGIIAFENSGDPIKSVAIWHITNGDRGCYEMITP